MGNTEKGRIFGTKPDKEANSGRDDQGCLISINGRPVPKVCSEPKTTVTQSTGSQEARDITQNTSVPRVTESSSGKDTVRNCYGFDTEGRIGPVPCKPVTLADSSSTPPARGADSSETSIDEPEVDSTEVARDSERAPPRPKQRERSKS